MTKCLFVLWKKEVWRLDTTCPASGSILWTPLATIHWRSSCWALVTLSLTCSFEARTKQSLDALGDNPLAKQLLGTCDLKPDLFIRGSHKAVFGRPWRQSIGEAVAGHL